MPLNLYEAKAAEKGIDQVRHVIGVAAGKGGVGKSTVTAHLARALARLGKSVGVVDADVYGPSMHHMLPCLEGPSRDGSWLVPAESKGIKLMSVAFFRGPKEAAVVRAPIANEIITQFLLKTQWGALDYLLIDFPPGTGDIQLTLMQQSQLSGAVLVTTPQEIALMDVRKAHECFRRLNVPTLGIIENMSYLNAGSEKIFPLGEGGGLRLAQEIGVPLLGQIPLEPQISLLGDQGETIENSPAALQFAAIAKKVLSHQELRYFEVIFKQMSTGSVIEERLKDSHSGSGIQKIFQNGPCEVVIEWTDGTLCRYDLSEIQRCCPCARCSENKPQAQGFASKAYSVGRYAVKFEFTSGCSAGIYPLTLLRQMKGLLV
ncbi:MAG: P-loop NTPase [Chlamydiales bacterium]|nr:P-loop NTPase [Chlamydiales bacterium]